MFQAKRVPIDLLLTLENEREFHRQAWDAVRDTVDPSIRLRSYDYYFDYALDQCSRIAQLLGLNPRGT